MVARGLDEATALYQIEANYVASKMRTIFIVLSALSAMIEIVLVVFIFRKAVVVAFGTLASEVDGLSNPQLVAPQAIEDKLRQIKERSKGRQLNRNKAVIDQDSESDSELESHAGANEKQEEEQALQDA